MKRFQIIFTLSALVLFGGCKKWLDINEDPTNPQIATAEVLIAPIQAQMSRNIAEDSRYIGKYVQFWGNQSTNDVWERHGYEFTSSDPSGAIWRMIYFNMGRNLELLIEDGITKEKYGFAGIGYAIKAWAYQVGTDYHGPLILTDAFPANENQYVFDYDDQPAVYQQVRVWADSAIYWLSKTDGKDLTQFLAGATGDQIYKGDLAKWRKFVYGLLALHYSHLTAKADFKTKYADSVIKYADLSFSSANDDATVFHNASVTAENNPLNALVNTTGYRIGYPIVALLSGGVRGTTDLDTLKGATLTTSKDPRLSRMLTPSADSVFRGVVATDGDPNSTNTRAVRPLVTRYVFHDKARFAIMSYAQIQFAKAEAAFIKGLTSIAHAAYLNGIRGHMDFVNKMTASWASTQAPISTTEINTYLASTEVAQTSATLTLKDIMLQKYIAQWGWAAVEQWVDLRKYKYDTALFPYYYVPVGSDLFFENNGKLAQRVRPRYNSEYIWNRTAMEKIGALNADYHTYEMWFSQP